VKIANGAWRLARATFAEDIRTGYTLRGLRGGRFAANLKLKKKMQAKERKRKKKKGI